MSDLLQLQDDYIAQKRRSIILSGVRNERHVKATRKKLSQLTPQERKAANKLPLDLLATEWLSEQETNTDLKLYLIENLLPTLVVGLEKLLNEVSVRSLAECMETQEDFNPINYLAQFMMRNNPLYSSRCQEHPYCTSMKLVCEEVKELVWSLDDHKLKELREQSRLRCMTREQLAADKVAAEIRKVKMLKSAYAKWLVPSETSPPLADMKIALQSWSDMLAIPTIKFQAEVLTVSLTPELQGLLWEEKDFVKSFMKLELLPETFEQLVSYLTICGIERKRRKLRERRSTQINTVFDHCNVSNNTGMIDRLRVVYLLICYYDSLTSELQPLVLNPREWPIMEEMELEELEEEEELRFGNGTFTTLSQKDVMEFLEEEVEGESTPSWRQAGEDEDGNQVQSRLASRETISTPPGKAIPQNTPTSSLPMLEQRLQIGSSSRVKSLRRMRSVSGMSAHITLEPSGPGGSWDHEKLSRGQFMVLVEQFLGSEPDQLMVDALLHYISDYYTETLEEMKKRLEETREQEELLARRRRVDQLYQIWDNNHSGYLPLDELQVVLSKWKGFEVNGVFGQVMPVLDTLGVEHGRMTRPQFHCYLDQITASLDNKEFNIFTDFLKTSMQLTKEQKHRSELRRQWLEKLKREGKISSLKLSVAMKNAIIILHKDVTEFGTDKRVTVLICLLAGYNFKPPSTHTHGPPSKPILCVKAASMTLELLGADLHCDSGDGVSFTAVDTSRPVHVASIQRHGNVHYYIPQHKTTEYDGSLIVVPIQTPPGPSVGTISIDTLRPIPSPASSEEQLPQQQPLHFSPLPSSFQEHEALFYQGVGQCVGEVYHWIYSRVSLLQVSCSALQWIHSRFPAIKRGEVYLVTEEPSQVDERPKTENGQDEPFLLHLMLSTAPWATPTTNIQKQIMKQDNPFKHHLFDCVETSEPFYMEAYGEHHLVHPIRDHTGCAVALVDLTITNLYACSLDGGLLREVTKIFNLLTSTFYHINCPPEARMKQEEDQVMGVRGFGVQKSVLENVTLGAGGDLTCVFDELILTDIRKRLLRLDNMMFAEMRCYVEPPEFVLQIVQALLHLLCPEKDCATWSQCKKLIHVSMVRAMKEYDPRRVPLHPKLATITKILADLPVGSLYKHSSLPTKLIYLWLRACIPILEHSAASVAP